MPHRSPSLDLLLKLHDSINEIICVLDAEGRFVYINKAAYRIWGYPPAELIGRPCYDLVVEEDRKQAMDKVAAASKLGATCTYENRYCRKDGSIITMHWEGQWHIADQLIYCTGRDITDQKRLEQVEQAYHEELVRTNEHLERITDGFFGMDENGRVTYWNQAAETMLNIPRKDILGKLVWDYMTEPLKSAFLQHYKQIKASKKPDSFELYSARVDGWLEANIYISGSGLSVYFRDITKKRKLEEQLQQEREQQQKRITTAVIKAAEEERAFVGKELHDNVNQVLTTIKLYNELCMSAAGNNQELLQKSTQLVQDAINEIRALSKRLSAPTLGGVKFDESISELVDSINTTQQLKVVYENDAEELNVSSEVHVAVYRVLQEQFTNILKHAKARIVRLCIKKDGTSLKISVTDDGQGFDAMQARKGMGIENMMSRIQAVNGQLCLSSAPGSGSVLDLSIPLQENES